MNTRISYLYRDGVNYKFYYNAVIPGEISEAQKESILASLDEGCFFIPGRVELPCEYAAGYAYDETADHPYCELDRDSFESTEELPTTTVTLEELAASFRSASGRWEDLPI